MDKRGENQAWGEYQKKYGLQVTKSENTGAHASVKENIDTIMEQFDELRKLIKNNDKNVNMKISWMSDNIAKIPKKKR